MDLNKLLRQPWFYKSPGPISIVFYGIIGLYGVRLLLKRVKYDRWRLINAFLDSLFLNGFIVLSGDILWMIICTMRFLGAYPQDLVLVVSVFIRDFAFMGACFLGARQRFREGVIRFKKTTFYSYLTILFFFVIIFSIAPDPTFTDWTYAIRQGASLGRILYSLIVPYGLGKIVSLGVIWSWWKN